MTMKRTAMIMPILLGVLLTTVSVSATELTEQPRQARQSQALVAKAWAFDPDPNLPNVLIMGDSNTIGFVIKLRELLRGKANVAFPLRENGAPDNCANSGYGLENIDRFVGSTKWAVIHFNWGLHDAIRFKTVNGKRVGDRSGEWQNSEWQNSPEVYAANLEKIVARLKQTDAKLIWGTSSVVNQGVLHVLPGDERILNEIATKIMTNHRIPINDIYALTKDFKPEEFRAPGDIHFSPLGFDRIAEQVAERIQKALEK